MVRETIICFVVCLQTTSFCEDGSVLMGAWGQEQFFLTISIKKIAEIQFFTFAWNSEEGSDYLFCCPFTEYMFV